MKGREKGEKVGEGEERKDEYMKCMTTNTSIHMYNMSCIFMYIVGHSYEDFPEYVQSTIGDYSMYWGHPCVHE